MVSKSYVGILPDGSRVFRIGTGLYKEIDNEFQKLDEAELRDFVESDDSGSEGESDESEDYPAEWYDKEFAIREEIYGDTRITM